MATPTLVHGSTGAAVETLQTKLNKLGARPALKVDGIFGPITEGEVKKFQKRLRPPLKPDGKVGTDTWAAIEFELKGGSKPNLKVPDWLPQKELEKFRETDRRTAQTIEKRIKGASAAATAFCGACKKEDAGLRKTTQKYEQTWKKILALSASSEKLIAEFEAGAFRNPVRVKAIQSKIDQIVSQITALSAEIEAAEALFAHLDAVKAALEKLRSFKFS